MAFLNWDTYLTPTEKVESFRLRTGDGFKNQRKRISQLYNKRSPKTVVCLGSGYLNDIPIDDIIKGGSRLFLVDWMKDASRQAFDYDVVTSYEGGYHCLICDTTGDPTDYCRRFSKPLKTSLPRGQKFCANFKPDKESRPACGSYQAGPNPGFLQADVTEGRASGFARRMENVLQRAKNPRAAFKLALQEARAAHRFTEALPIDTGSVDLVTSSMIVSQFDFEPYEFLAKNLAARFGIDALNRREKELQPLMEELRDHLFLTLMEGHCREIHRLLKADGQVYFSVEAFHRDQPNDNWFEVPTFPKVMEVLRRHFLFDFDFLPALNTPDQMEIMGGESMVYSYILTQKSSPGD
ncbi:MAG: hypothetical protein IID18_07680 [Nitrospinae bacterium]|nr:hypothetical protein [Nitrospinota bacterium]